MVEEGLHIFVIKNLNVTTVKRWRSCVVDCLVGFSEGMSYHLVHMKRNIPSEKNDFEVCTV